MAEFVARSVRLMHTCAKTPLVNVNCIVKMVCSNAKHAPNTASVHINIVYIIMLHSAAIKNGGFNWRPLVQWPTRPLGGWASEAPGPRGPRKAKFWLAIAKS